MPKRRRQASRDGFAPTLDPFGDMAAILRKTWITRSDSFGVDTSRTPWNTLAIATIEKARTASAASRGCNSNATHTTKGMQINFKG